METATHHSMEAREGATAAPADFVPLHLETRTHVSTAVLCRHLNRKEQTARGSRPPSPQRAVIVGHKPPRIASSVQIFTDCRADWHKAKFFGAKKLAVSARQRIGAARWLATWVPEHTELDGSGFCHSITSAFS